MPVWYQVRVCTGGTCDPASTLVGSWEIRRGGQRGRALGIPLLHGSEPAEFPFAAIVGAVMIGVAGRKVAAADVVARLDAFDDRAPETVRS